MAPRLKLRFTVCRSKSVVFFFCWFSMAISFGDVMHYSHGTEPVAFVNHGGEEFAVLGDRFEWLMVGGRSQPMRFDHSEFALCVVMNQPPLRPPPLPRCHFYGARPKTRPPSGGTWDNRHRLVTGGGGAGKAARRDDVDDGVGKKARRDPDTGN